MADNAPSVAASDSPNVVPNVRSASVDPWAQAMYRINEIGTAALASHNRHHSNLDVIGQLSILNSSHGANELNQKYGVLYTEPNAESAHAEQTMDVSGTAQMTAAAVQNVIGTANASIASSMADLKAILSFQLGDLKAALLPALQAIANSLAVVQGNLAAGAPNSGAVKG